MAYVLSEKKWNNRGLSVREGESPYARTCKGGISLYKESQVVPMQVPTPYTDLHEDDELDMPEFSYMETNDECQ